MCVCLFSVVLFHCLLIILFVCSLALITRCALFCLAGFCTLGFLHTCLCNDLQSCLVWLKLLKLKVKNPLKLKLMPCLQVYRHCSQIDISGLKDPRLHEQTIISGLYNLGRLLDDDGRHQVLLTYLLTYLLVHTRFISQNLLVTIS